VAALRRYSEVWRIPGAPALLVGGIFARLPIGMTPLALLLLVEGTTDRYTPAAIASAVFALAGAAASPIAGRLCDRLGPAPVLIVTAIAHPIALLGLILSADRGLPLAAIWVAAGLVGATFPPLTAAVRGAWSTLTASGSGREHLRSPALAAETTLFEVVFVIGPLLVAGFLIVSTPAAALFGAGVITLIGTIGLSRSPAIRGWRRDPTHVTARGLGPLTSPGFPALLVCVFGLSIAFGAVSVIVPAFADFHSSSESADGLAGVLLAMWAIGSTIGGVWFGTRSFQAPLQLQFALFLGAVSISLFVFSVMSSPFALGTGLLIGGAAIAPALTLENSMVAHTAPAGMVNEAFTWVVTVSVAASSLGGAVAGPLVDHPGGLPWAFVVAGASVACAALVAGWPNGPLAKGGSPTAGVRDIAQDAA